MIVKTQNQTRPKHKSQLYKPHTNNVWDYMFTRCVWQQHTTLVSLFIHVLYWYFNTSSTETIDLIPY